VLALEQRKEEALSFLHLLLLLPFIYTYLLRSFSPQSVIHSYLIIGKNEYRASSLFFSSPSTNTYTYSSWCCKTINKWQAISVQAQLVTHIEFDQYQ
jgi:hypothetical protein